MSNDSVLRPRGDEEGSPGRAIPAINHRATIVPSLRDEEDCLQGAEGILI
jgi:hypothetical protein